MKQFKVVPTIQEFETCKDFADTYGIGKGDLVFVSNGTKNRLFPELDNSGAIVVNYRNYGSGEPTDLMVEGICKDLEGKTYNEYSLLVEVLYLMLLSCLLLKQFHQ